MFLRILCLTAIAFHLTYSLQSFEENSLPGRPRNWSTQIKNCIISCKNTLYKGHKDMNYCIEGCRIRVYRPIYYCVYEQCNNRGLGINETFHPVRYHQCVHLCKTRPRKRSKPSSYRPPPQYLPFR